jgi:GT2 family glycosyltransferase
MALLSIIIVNYRSTKVTCNCLLSLNAALQNLNTEIILIDNGTLTDDRPLYASIIPTIIYIPVKDNVGFARANNIGIEKAQGEYILLLNSDTLFPDPDAISKTLHFLREEEKNGVGLVGCKLLNEQGLYEPSFFPFLSDSIWLFAILDSPILYRIMKIARFYDEPISSKEVLDISGAFMLMNREVAIQVGPLDPDFFLYCEESEWCRNRICMHYRILYYPHASIVHLGGASTPAENIFIQQRLSISLFWYKKGWLNYILYSIIAYLNVIIYLPFYFTFPKNHFYRKYVVTYILLIRYILFYIPSNQSAFGSRKMPLVYGMP